MYLKTWTICIHYAKSFASNQVNDCNFVTVWMEWVSLSYFLEWNYTDRQKEKCERDWVCVCKWERVCVNERESVCVNVRERVCVDDWVYPRLLLPSWLACMPFDVSPKWSDTQNIKGRNGHFAEKKTKTNMSNFS